MSDIVERLRSTYLTASFNALNGCQDCGIAANDASQAADEITRLTAENEALANDRDGYVQLLTDQNNALTARVAELEGENKNLKLMVEVLRKALKESPND